MLANEIKWLRRALVNHNWHSENKHKRHKDLSHGSAKYNTCLVHVVASQWTRVALNSFQVIQWSTWIPRCSSFFTLSRLRGISTSWSLSPLQDWSQRKHRVRLGRATHTRIKSTPQTRTQVRRWAHKTRARSLQLKKCSNLKNDERLRESED